MRVLHALRLWLLPLAAHFDFFKKLYDALVASGAAVQAATAALMPEYNTWLEREDALMRWVRKSALTELIADADRLVDHILAGINAAVTAALYLPDELKVAAANRLHIMLKSYGRVANKSYDEEAGDVRTLLEQFTGAYDSDVNVLALYNRVAELQNAFNDFESLLAQRETAQTGKPPYTARSVRKGMDGVYHQMVHIIDGGCASGMAPDFAYFIDALNPDIDRLNAEFHHARKDLSVADHCVIEPLGTQPFTEKAVTPIPKAHWREKDKPTVELVFAKDFSVTYKNNIKIGMAELTIHGKGDYKGQKTATFNIAR